jgi:archaellum component FlaF (FlaF/FlaG flagellin family)
VYQVAANETTEFELDLEFFLTSIQQPTVQDTVTKEYDVASVYSVSANDNLPVSAAFWTDYGGDMSFEILGDGSRVKVTITGPTYEPLSPYTIGISDGSTSYSTLRIVGTGMDFNRLLYTEKTGLLPAEAPLVKGQEIDNPAIDTLADAKKYALSARRLYSLPTQTYSTSSNEFPRLAGSIPSIFYPSFDDYNDSLPTGYTFANFNSDYIGKTFDDFTFELGNVVPQGFGEVAGSRVKLDDAVYRVRSTTITPDIVSFDAEYDTLFSDLNDVYGAVIWSELASAWTGLGSTWATVLVLPDGEKTFTDFNTTFGGVNFKDYALMPMRVEPVAA